MRKMALIAACMVLVVQIAAAAESKVSPVIIFDKEGQSRSLSGMLPTLFPHKQHADLYKCSACHPDLFVEKIGANKITMRDQMNGKYCGACHDGITSFGMSDCELCHKKE